MRSRTPLALALVAQVAGAGAVLLLATRTWQTVVTPRPLPFSADTLRVAGRTLDPAPTAFALVALAGAVAVLATKGLWRRLVGVLVALSGAGVIWRSAAAVPAVRTARARALVMTEHPHVERSLAQVPHVTTHPGWGIASILAGVLVLLAGALIAVRGGRWAAMSARYESPVAGAPDGPPAAGDDAGDDDDDRARARADAALWSALERGEDPTARDPHDPGRPGAV